MFFLYYLPLHIEIMVNLFCFIFFVLLISISSGLSTTHIMYPPHHHHNGSVHHQKLELCDVYVPINKITPISMTPLH